MVNETTKILPVDDWDVKGVQEWLEGMALQGFYLDDTIGTWWHFNGGEPKTVRYRIDTDVKKRGRIEPEKKEDYETMGWHYVVTFREYHIFMADDPEVEELHTDCRVEGIALKKLEKSMWGVLLQVLLIAVLPYLVSDFQRNELISAIRYPAIFWTGENAAIIFVYLFLAVYFVRTCVSLIKMRAFRRALAEGVDYKYNKDGFRIRKSHRVWDVFFWCSICLLFFTMFSSCHSVHDFDSPDMPRGILSLENLESGKVITDAEGFPDYLGGWIDDRWNPLLEDNYQIFQRCLVEGQAENSQPVSVTLEAEYYELRISGMADLLYKEMVEKNIRTAPDTYDTTFVDSTELDACVVGSAKDKQILVGQKGKVVIYVAYNGDENLVENAAKIETLMLETPGQGW